MCGFAVAMRLLARPSIVDIVGTKDPAEDLGGHGILWSDKQEIDAAQLFGTFGMEPSYLVTS